MNDSNTPREANTGSVEAKHQDIVTDQNRAEVINGMDLKDVMNAAKAHEDSWKEIHESIYSTFITTGNLTQPQIDVMNAFLVQYAPEIGSANEEPKAETATV